MSSSWRTSLTIRSSALAEGSFWPWATHSVASVSNAKMTTCDRDFIGFSPCNYGAHAGHNFDAETRRFETLALGRDEGNQRRSGRWFHESRPVLCLLGGDLRDQAAISSNKLLAFSTRLATGSDLEITAEAPAARASFSTYRSPWAV